MQYNPVMVSNRSVRCSFASPLVRANPFKAKSLLVAGALGLIASCSSAPTPGGGVYNQSDSQGTSDVTTADIGYVGSDVTREVGSAVLSPLCSGSVATFALSEIRSLENGADVEFDGLKQVGGALEVRLYGVYILGSEPGNTPTIKVGQEVEVTKAMASACPGDTFPIKTSPVKISVCSVGGTACSVQFDPNTNKSTIVGDSKCSATIAAGSSGWLKPGEKAVLCK